MPYPGVAGSVWAADTWAADTWTEDSWAGAVAPEPEPEAQPASGGGVSQRDIDDVLGFYQRRVRIRAKAAPATAYVAVEVTQPAIAVVVPAPEPVRPPTIHAAIYATATPSTAAVEVWTGIGDEEFDQEVERIQREMQAAATAAWLVQMRNL